MTKDSLRPKQRLFIAAYLVCKNATQAAIQAGYSVDTAKEIGYENLTKPHIREAIRLGLAKQETDLNEKAAILGVTKERMIAELSKVAFANMDDFAQVTDNGVTLKSTHQRKPGTGKVIKKVSVSQNGGSKSLELHSKDRAQELLCKLLGWLKEKVEVTNDQRVQVILTMPANGSERIKDV